MGMGQPVKNQPCVLDDKILKCEENSSLSGGKCAMAAKYKGMICEHKYTDKPGPTACPECGNVSVEWLNYKEMESKYFR